MTLTVKNATGDTQTVNTLPDLGAAAANASLPVAIAPEQLVGLATKAAVDAVKTAVDVVKTAVDAGKAAVDATASARRCWAVAPHATDPLPYVTKALRAGGDGTITFRPIDSAADVLHPVVAGERIDVVATHVRVAGTTVSVIAYA